MVSVIAVVLNYNDAGNTLECLESVNHSDFADIKTILVDNGSTDDSVRVIAIAMPTVEIVSSSHNLGFAGGMNLGISQACRRGAKYVLILNNDIIVATDAIARLVQSAEDNPTAGIFVPKIYFYSRRDVIWSAGARWRRFPPSVKMIGLGKYDEPKYDRPTDLDYATGCVMLIRTSALAQIGLFDENFFMYQDDYDFCYRSRQSGWKIRYVPQSHIWHKVSSGLGGGSAAWWYYWSRSMTRLYLHTWHYSRPSFFAILAWFMLREFFKANLSFLRPFLAGVRDEARALEVIKKDA